MVIISFHYNRHIQWWCHCACCDILYQELWWEDSYSSTLYVFMLNGIWVVPSHLLDHRCCTGGIPITWYYDYPISNGRQPISGWCRHVWVDWELSKIGLFWSWDISRIRSMSSLWMPWFPTDRHVMYCVRLGSFLWMLIIFCVIDIMVYTSYFSISAVGLSIHICNVAIFTGHFCLLPAQNNE